MQLSPKIRRATSTAVGSVLALVGMTLSLGLAGPAQASVRASTTWVMLKSETYGNWCLSTNAQTSNSGAGTHFVYLAVCNPSTPAQWWHSPTNDGQVQNYQDFGGTVWELSANNTQPAGGAAGTYGAYTAAVNGDPVTHDWYLPGADGLRLPHFTNDGTQRDLSASSSDPEISGTYRVFTTASSSAGTHIFLIGPGSPPACFPCGGLS